MTCSRDDLRWLLDLELFREAVVVVKYSNQKLDWMLDPACSYAAEGIEHSCAAGTILGKNRLVNKSSLELATNFLLIESLQH